MMAYWEWIRVTGVLAYWLLTLSILFGLIRSVANVSPSFKQFGVFGHALFGSFACLLGAVHGFLLLFDTYRPYTLFEIIVPFTATYKPLLSASGTISLLLMLVIILSSDFRAKVGQRVWKWLHTLSYPAWVFAFIHGCFLGTDSTTSLGQVFFWATGTVIAVFLLLRAFMKKNARR
ncbi:ferric reductase-like transmembrane domain-containing protein [Microbacteriaceae bacterium 4G12]